MFDRCSRSFALLLIAAAIPGFVAAQKHPAANPQTAEAQTEPWEQPQPAVEKLDLSMYTRIRDEGLHNSHIMEYASALADDIGPRLTGSPNVAKANAWTRDQFTAMGLANVHLEDWGEFGMGWQQLNTWVRMTSPDTAVFIAQAAPWSPSTTGPVSGEAVLVNIQNDKDFDQYRGKLAGKIVLLGEMRAAPAVDQPLFRRYTDEQLKATAQDRIGGVSPLQRQAQFLNDARARFNEKIAQFLADEKVAAVIEPSRDGQNGGGSGGTIFDDNAAALGRTPYVRVYRLLHAHVPVTIEVNVDVKFTGDHEHAFNTIAEIPGTDPNLKDQLVMVGGHLDSWIAGTGATDNGAGTVVAMEVMRILKSLDVHPRRTIRVALWTGEEEGLLGSRGYVRQHFGDRQLSTAPDQLALPEIIRGEAGPVMLKPEQKLVSGYFNLDNGSGRIRGVYLQQNAAAGPIFSQWIAPLEDLGVTTISMRNTGGTDHLNFDAVDIPGFQFIQDPLDYESRTHHSNSDTYEHLQPADLMQAATIEAIFVYNTAMRDQMLPRKPMPHPERREQQAAPLKNLFPGASEQQPSSHTEP